MRSALALALIFAACGDDVTATPDAPVTEDASPDADTSPKNITLRFVPKVGDAAFACGQSYANMGAENTTITPRDFRFYVHDVKLIDAAGEHVPVTLATNDWQYQGVALLDFENFTGGCQDGTPETNMELTGTVPNGMYTGISFSIGIPAALNHKDLTTLPAPLNVTGLWWGWSYGHIFLAAVTHTEITDPQPGTNDHYFHLGSVGCTGDPETGETVTCTKPNRPLIEVTGFDPLTKPVIADWGALLSKSNLATEIGCHSGAQGPCAWPFDFVGLNFLTGSNTPTTQKLFRPGT
ncbi:MAG: metallo-mystery pair system four-Cys motif protein [Kofleriaceae bacterium]|nr:metallo-mystery pair system four-Cys motif protein [Kofleriaceae bacterium]